MTGSDYHHWPTEQAEEVIYVPRHSRRTERDNGETIVYRWTEDHEDAEFEHWPSTWTVKKVAYPRQPRRVDSNEYLMIEPRSRRDDHKSRDCDADDDGTTVLYVAANKVESPPPPRRKEPVIWLGRTEREVKRDNKRIAARQQLPTPPRKRGLIEKSEDDQVWVVEYDGEMELRTYGEVMTMFENREGDWKANPKARDHPYFLLHKRKH